MTVALIGLAIAVIVLILHVRQLLTIRSTLADTPPARQRSRETATRPSAVGTLEQKSKPPDSVAYPLRRLSVLNGTYRHLALSFVHAVLAAVSLTGAFLLRYDFVLVPEHREGLVLGLPIFVVSRLVGVAVVGLHRVRWRFVGTHDVKRLVVGNLVGTGVAFIAIALLLPVDVAPTVYLIEVFLNTWLAAGVWILYRTAYETTRRTEFLRSTRGLVVVGGGPITDRLQRELKRSGNPSQVTIVPAETEGMAASRDRLLDLERAILGLSRAYIDRMIIVAPDLDSEATWKALQLARARHWDVQVVPQDWTRRRYVLRTLRDVSGGDVLPHPEEAAQVS